MLIFRFTVLFWTTTRICLHALMPKKRIIMYEMLFSSYWLLSTFLLNTPSPLIGQLTHA